MVMTVFESVITSIVLGNLWHKLLGRDAAALQKLSEIMVTALKLTAATGLDVKAETLRSQVNRGQILNALQEIEREYCITKVKLYSHVIMLCYLGCKETCIRAHWLCTSEDP